MPDDELAAFNAELLEAVEPHGQPD
jgi:hypothetical protein